MTGESSFVVVLGFYSVQKEDIIKKELIEPLSNEMKQIVAKAVINSLPIEYADIHVIFI
jgi:hypothetical protein